MKFITLIATLILLATSGIAQENEGELQPLPPKSQEFLRAILNPLLLGPSYRNGNTVVRINPYPMGQGDEEQARLLITVICEDPTVDTVGVQAYLQTADGVVGRFIGQAEVSRGGEASFKIITGHGRSKATKVVPNLTIFEGKKKTFTGGDRELK
jgi:hypothetical protein